MTCTYYGFFGLFFGYVMMVSVPMIVIDEYLSVDYYESYGDYEIFGAFKKINFIFLSFFKLIIGTQFKN
jgi:hypothetical protein